MLRQPSFCESRPGSTLQFEQGLPSRTRRRFGLDMSLSKRVRISETKNLEFRMDAINILNHPNWGADINSTSFGRITTATGSRSLTGNLRLNF